MRDNNFTAHGYHQDAGLSDESSCRAPSATLFDRKSVAVSLTQYTDRIYKILLNGRRGASDVNCEAINTAANGDSGCQWDVATCQELAAWAAPNSFRCPVDAFPGTEAELRDKLRSQAFPSTKLNNRDFFKVRKMPSWPRSWANCSPL